MPVSVAYLFVVIIWSTTPLGIIWSSETIEPTFSLFLRMLIAVLVGYPLMKYLKVDFDWRPKALRVYCYSSLSVAFGMLLCYLAARNISSGIMSLSFGIAPILSGLLAQRIMAESRFSNLKKLALVVSLSGLALVCWENLSTGHIDLISLIYVLIAVLFFSLSTVLVKSVEINLHPLTTTMGTLLLTLPIFFLFWLLSGAELNVSAWSNKSIYAVVYLGVFASLIGFLAYFFILKMLSASTVSLVVMITPVLSSTLGVLVNDEYFSYELVLGGVLVILGLGVFQFGHLFIRKKSLPKLISET